MGWLLRLVQVGFALVFVGVLVGVVGLWVMFRHYDERLPDYTQLASYEPAIATRIYAADGRFLAEYAREQRVFVPIAAVPDRVKNAFIAAEDQNFRTHPGIDAMAVVAAAVDNVQRYRDNRRPRGASTITQQVAKNFFLTNEVSLDRKIAEAILAMRMERAFTKDRILELYLNEIFLGARSYGVAAAALNYFDKSLDELTIGEAAFLAGLPQAPSAFNPRRNPEGARARRDYVLDRMLEDGYVTAAEVEAAKAEPIVVTGRDRSRYARGPYFAEEVRRRLEGAFGRETLYEAGLTVRTTLDPELQAITDEALRDGLFAFDRANGYRGPLGQIDLTAGEWQDLLVAERKPIDLGGEWRFAVVLEQRDRDAVLGLVDGRTVMLRGSDLAWARPVDERGRRGPAPRRAADILDVGDMIMVHEDDDGTIGLRQVPRVNGAIVALDPNTGRVLALSGGFSFKASSFNRATQALRQPGSAFKPFVYLAALEHGYTPQTIVDDSPIALSQGPGLPLWRPQNYSGESYGPSSLRLGLEKSRNQMTVRVAHTVGMENVMATAQTFGIERGLTPYLAASLGSNEVDLLSLTAAYATFASGGRKVTPHVIDRLQDRYGRTVQTSDGRRCDHCALPGYDGGLPPVLADERETIADPRRTYQITSMLQGVIERGTGQRAKALGRPLAGKTGTTNDSRDTWFIGFSPDLVVGVFVGYDQPRSLGRRATGSSVALPIWVDVMGQALEDAPIRPFAVPPGLRLVIVRSGSSRIMEAFVAGTEPGSGYEFAGNYRPPSSSLQSPTVRPGASVGVSSGGLY
ncbi:MAG: penicillin-binding protein 1A [Pseudomonadota bacterium]